LEAKAVLWEEKSNEAMRKDQKDAVHQKGETQGGGGGQAPSQRKAVGLPADAQVSLDDEEGPGAVAEYERLRAEKKVELKPRPPLRLRSRSRKRRAVLTSAKDKELDAVKLQKAEAELAARREEMVPTEARALVALIDDAEKTYCRDMDAYVEAAEHDLTRTRVESRELEDLYHTDDGVKGLKVELQRKRRSLRRKLTYDDGLVQDICAMSAVNGRKLAERLCTIAQDAGMTIDDFKGAVPLASYSYSSLYVYGLSQGSQPTTVGRVPNYTQIMCREGVLTLPPNHQGRKANTSVVEAKLVGEEKDLGFPWMSWWLALGGFASCNEVDDNGWTPLMHSIDSMTFSKRACISTMQLVLGTSPAFIKCVTTGSQPTMWTALHFACDGSDVLFKKAELVTMLIEKNADIEARDSKGNTPLLIAAGSGLTDVCLVLLNAGADRTAININGHGALFKGAKSSKSLGAVLEELGCPQTASTVSGRTRQGTSQSREARYATTTSAHPKYAGGGNWAGVGWSDREWREWRQEKNSEWRRS